MGNVIVLGAGMVGSAMALDLAKQHTVTSADISPKALLPLAEQGINTVVADLSQPEHIKKLVKGFDLVVGAVPGFLGFAMAQAAIEAGVDLVDISFFEEDPFGLNKLAQEHGVTAIVDCGVAPGLPNLLVGSHHQAMRIHNFEYYVGGLPHKRQWPYEYKAPFSPIDVLEEYTRPARMVVGGQVITKPALSDAELMDFPPVGRLEAFNSDGLRTLIRTVDIKNMKEKTLRYPGHIRLMEVLRETGFFGKEAIDVKGVAIRPIDLTSKLLFPHWQLEPQEREFTILKVIVEGEEEKQKVRYTYDLYDEYNPETNTSSMARTTGYTCTAAANLVLSGAFKRPGIYPPELIGAWPGCLDYVLKYLEERGVQLVAKRTLLG
ncbi:saccharopine dehydrogenase family protein [soil metagenome]